MTLRDKLKFWILLSSYVEMIVRGTSPLSLPNSIADSLEYLKAFGGTEQNGTPTPDAPVDIVSNNGVLKVNSQGQIYADGTVETINVHGKNLNGGGELDHQGYTSTGGTSTVSTFCGTLWKIKVNPGEKYTVSYGNFPDGINGVYISTWLADGTWNTRQAISTSGAYTYTIPAGVGEVNFTLYKTGGVTIADNSWMQVEAGEIATDYEPYYDGGTATAEMLLKVGDYQDEQEILSGAVTRNVGIIVFDGTENWTKNPSLNVFLVNISEKPVGKVPTLCSHYEYSSLAQAEISDKKYGQSGTNQNIFFRDDNYTTINTWKQYIADQYNAGTPVIVIYPLATATTESVAGQALQVQQGDNYVEITQAAINGLELEVKYKKQA